jgi:carbonic anhydrase
MSEHRIDGEQFDLEMQIMHTPAEETDSVKAGVLAILFSVKDETSEKDKDVTNAIDNFFGSLNWGETTENPKVDSVPFGDLMKLINTDDRFIYLGSSTMPPCTPGVYWNVLKTVYPIKRATYNLFRK